MTDRVGQYLGNYQLIEVLGQGHWASVYLGQHQHLHTQAAIKVLHGALTPSETESFLSEARTLARLRHRHIVRVLDFGVQLTFSHNFGSELVIESIKEESSQEKGCA
jgi:eukaryotic-like serine/threonine-protein kinase